jgi:hypothetical protein
MFRPYFGHLQASVFETVTLHEIVKSIISMLLHIVILTKMCLLQNKTLSPLHVIFFLQHPCLCPLHMYVLTPFYTRDIHTTSKNVHTKGAQAWTLQKENNVEWGESFILKQTYFSVNNNMQ